MEIHDMFHIIIILMLYNSPMNYDGRSCITSIYTDLGYFYRLLIPSFQLNVTLFIIVSDICLEISCFFLIFISRPLVISL